VLLGGLDEAGRGPVLGPLVIALVVLSRKTEILLQAEGVKDSKLLTPKKREDLYNSIKEDAVYCNTTHISASEIDLRRKTESLNYIESSTMLNMVNKSREDGILINNLYIDSVDAKPDRMAIPFKAASPSQTVICQHKADSTFVVVGAASIIAKVERDIAIQKIEKATGFSIGSGYPSDPVTKRFLKEYFRKYGCFPEFVRSSWQTAIDIQQKTQ